MASFLHWKDQSRSVFLTKHIYTRKHLLVNCFLLFYNKLKLNKMSKKYSIRRNHLTSLIPVPIRFPYVAAGVTLFVSDLFLIIDRDNIETIVTYFYLSFTVPTYKRWILSNLFKRRSFPRACKRIKEICRKISF